MAVVEETYTGIAEIPKWMEREKNRFHYRKENFRGMLEEYKDPTFGLVARIKLPRMKHARDILRAGEAFLPRRIRLVDVDRNKWGGGLLMDTRTRDKEELIDQTTRKQDWNKMYREICGPRDYVEEHNKKKRKKEKETEAKYKGTR